MKHLLTLLLILPLVFFGSCSIYEEVYFLENGNIKYKMSFDMSEMLAMAPAEERSKMPSDSTLSLAELVKQKLDMGKLSEEDKKQIEYISPLYLNMKSDDEAKTAITSLYGDFENATALNNALTAIGELSKKNKDGGVPTGPRFDQFQNMSNYFWDGKTMRRNMNPMDDVGNGSLDKLKDTNLFSSLAGGRMKVKYHFPHKVKEVDNPDATTSLDGKTVIVDYPATVLFESTEKTNISIVTE